MSEAVEYNRQCGCDECTGVRTSVRPEDGSYQVEIGATKYAVQTHNGTIIAVYRVTWRGFKALQRKDWPHGL